MVVQAYGVLIDPKSVGNLRETRCSSNNVDTRFFSRLVVYKLPERERSPINDAQDATTQEKSRPCVRRGAQTIGAGRSEDDSGGGHPTTPGCLSKGQYGIAFPSLDLVKQSTNTLFFSNPSCLLYSEDRRRTSVPQERTPSSAGSRK